MLARFAGGFAILASALTLTQPAGAQSYPNKPVRLVIAFPAGGSIDTLGRILAGKLSEDWGQNVVVENRPGAGGNLGAAAAAQAAPDGYTLHLGAQTLAVNVTIAPHQGFDPVRDFEPIMLVATAQDVLMVAPSAPYRTVQDLIADARARPDQLNYASLGPGSSAHLASVLFAQVAGIKLQHVPYPTGMSQAVTDIMTGRISLWLATLGGALGNVQAGKVRALAVSGRSAQRSAAGRADLQGAGRGDGGGSHLVCVLRAQGHAARGDRQGQPRRGAHPGTARHQGARRHARLSLYRRLARGARELSQERDGQVGRGGQERQSWSPLAEPAARIES